MAMKIQDRWWTAPAESDTGKLVMVTGRDCVDKAMDSGKYIDRIEITWHYEGDATGMPDDETSEKMQEVTEALQAEFKADPVAVMTGIYTGDGQRNWVLYTRNPLIFNKVLNKALGKFDETFPIVIYAERDPEWSEYSEMREQTYIPPEENKD